MKKISNNQIKLFMVFLMTLDSLSYFLTPNLSAFYSLLLKIAVGWFAFAAAEGVTHTSNLKKYNIRLYFAALIMFLGNLILNTGFGMGKAPLYSNVFLTLALGVSSLTVFIRMGDKTSRSHIKRLLKGTILAALGMICQYGYIMIPVMSVSYWYRKNPQRRDYALVVISIILLVSDLISANMSNCKIFSISASGNFLFILVVPFIYMYNGERGKNSFWTKIFFYIYYPLHLWIISAVVNIM